MKRVQLIMKCLYDKVEKGISRLCQLNTNPRLIWGEGISVEELPPSDWLVGMPLGIFLIADWLGRPRAIC